VVVTGFLLLIDKTLLSKAFLGGRPYGYPDPFAHDLFFTFVMLLFWLCAVGLVWAVIWDQRYRCRDCLRRLRMPIRRGGWNHILLGAPQTEYICPYGHGTLTVAELQITGSQSPAWAAHEDIWTELYALDKEEK
jgi:hypothetical protein